MCTLPFLIFTGVDKVLLVVAGELDPPQEHWPYSPLVFFRYATANPSVRRRRRSCLYSVARGRRKHWEEER